MASIKQRLKQRLIDRQHTQYENTLATQGKPYDNWIKNQEKKLQAAPPVFKSKLRQLSNDVFCQNLPSLSRRPAHGILLLTLCEGTLNSIAIPLIKKEFDADKGVVLIYGDEDTLTGAVRSNPWFKPDWSPDRFLSGFYFGSLVAVRASALKKAYLACRRKEQLKDRLDSLPNPEKLYLLLFEMLKEQNAFAKRHQGQVCPVRHIPQVLYHSCQSGYEQTKDLHLPETAVREWEAGLGIAGTLEGSLLSVIIPSKDHPDVLFRCLDSLLEKTSPACAFDIVIVDNGSCAENRERISRKVEELNQLVHPDTFFRGCKYLYEPMPFNFSHMCNLGAANTKGQLLLFLNDDVEIIQENWMLLMASKALLPYAGAVGTKLLYPGSDTIQHAGVTNISIGPAHKLQYMNDREVHYFGMNRGVHDMVAVTGACLLTRRAVYDECGGFCETLAVAFNDVDLCYTIYKKGYYNIERNDVVFYHHESLSRGNDNLSEEKLRRHIQEKTTLYERHPDLEGRDPFYHPYLITDVLVSEYFPVFHYYKPWGYALDMFCPPARDVTSQIKRVREDSCLGIGVEIASRIYEWIRGAFPEQWPVAKEAVEKEVLKRKTAQGNSLSDEAAQKGSAGKIPPEKAGGFPVSEYFNYYFVGFSFVIGSDNACYERLLLLKNCDTKKVWAIPVTDQRRPDIQAKLTGQTNVELAGFTAKLRDGELAPGVYQMGMLVKDKCSRQRLVNWIDRTIEIPGGPDM